jgi:hypothetical protein
MSRGFAIARPTTRGSLLARFVLRDGKPEFVTGDEGERHYTFDLIFEPEGGGAVESVTYMLDEETYHDPIRLAEQTGRRFTTRTTSYGDYLVVAQVETEDGFDAVSGMLSELLRRGHPDAAGHPAITRAISDIASN